ncbi:hypothetical protein AB0K23_36270 [Streptomyces sp. NPDC049602]|uniref:hypothetical protein n=1 Tax=Streptomyces sp. NPDC049602 TaxID=3155504 RepID=UPI00341D6152
MVEKKWSEAFQCFVPLAHEGFEELVGGDHVVTDELLCQVTVGAYQLDKWAVADVWKVDTADGKAVAVALWEAVQVQVAPVGLGRGEIALIGHFVEALGIPRFQQIGVVLSRVSKELAGTPLVMLRQTLRADAAYGVTPGSSPCARK